MFLINTETQSQDIAKKCGSDLLELMGDQKMRAAVSTVFERGEFKVAVAQSLCFLKRKMFCPQKKIISYSSCENRAVSYTHLDVYKRQVEYSSANDRPSMAGSSKIQKLLAEYEERMMYQDITPDEAYDELVEAAKLN